MSEKQDERERPTVASRALGIALTEWENGNITDGAFDRLEAVLSAGVIPGDDA